MVFITMPIIYRPEPNFRRNIRGVIYPLTAAIHRVFGSRAQDQGRPIGAFYTINVDSRAWEYLGGIWYRAYNEEKVLQRAINQTTTATTSRLLKYWFAHRQPRTSTAQNEPQAIF
jgi:hypothetical protein